MPISRENQNYAANRPSFATTDMFYATSQKKQRIVSTSPDRPSALSTKRTAIPSELKSASFLI
jgi:hypothetical protein